MTAALILALLAAQRGRGTTSAHSEVHRSASIYADSNGTPPTHYRGYIVAQLVPVRPQKLRMVASDVYLESASGARTPVTLRPSAANGGNADLEFEIDADFERWPQGLARWRGSIRVQIVSGKHKSTTEVPVSVPVYLPGRPTSEDKLRPGAKFLTLQDLTLSTLLSRTSSGKATFRASSGLTIDRPLSQPLLSDLRPLREDDSVRPFRDRYLGRTVFFRHGSEGHMTGIGMGGGGVSFGTPYRVVAIYRLATGYGRVTLRHAQMEDASKEIVVCDPYLVAIGKAGSKQRFYGLFAGQWHWERVASLVAPPRKLIGRTEGGRFAVVAKAMTRDEVAWLNGYPGDELAVSELNRLTRWEYREMSPFSWSVTFRGNRVISVAEPGNLP